MIPLASLAALIAVGLGVDFSGQARTEQEIRDIAGHCARVGAGMITVDQSPDPTLAMSVAQDCLAANGASGSVTAHDDGVRVAVEGMYQTKLLTIIGISHLPCRGEALATIDERR